MTSGAAAELLRAADRLVLDLWLSVDESVKFDGASIAYGDAHDGIVQDIQGMYLCVPSRPPPAYRCRRSSTPV